MQTQKQFKIIFTDRANADAMIYYILKQSKETMLKFSKRTTFCESDKWLNAVK